MQHRLVPALVAGMMFVGLGGPAFAKRSISLQRYQEYLNNTNRALVTRTAPYVSNALHKTWKRTLVGAGGFKKFIFKSAHSPYTGDHVPGGWEFKAPRLNPVVQVGKLVRAFNGTVKSRSNQRILRGLGPIATP